jgi:hypothetical protein
MISKIFLTSLLSALILTTGCIHSSSEGLVLRNPLFANIYNDEEEIAGCRLYSEHSCYSQEECEKLAAELGLNSTEQLPYSQDWCLWATAEYADDPEKICNLIENEGIKEDCSWRFKGKRGLWIKWPD